jgi:hypothetical protein
MTISIILGSTVGCFVRCFERRGRMFEMVPGVGWLLLAYIVGTGFGLWVSFQRAVGVTIDSLIENGYLKTRKGLDGELEILKHNEE